MAESLTILFSKMEEIIYNDTKFYKIKDFPNYYISKCGKIYSKKRTTTQGRILKNALDTNNYLIINLMKDKIKYMKRVHRLVAETFIPNLTNKPQVNHKNGIKTDNNVINLEWMTSFENQQHRFKVLGHKGLWLGITGKEHPASKKVNQYNLDGTFIKTWDCVMQVQREYGYNGSSISMVCSGERKTARGYKWRYA